jgi:hypothetical protein
VRAQTLLVVAQTVQVAVQTFAQVRAQTLLVVAQTVQVVVQTTLVADPYSKILLPCSECGGKGCKLQSLQA